MDITGSAHNGSTPRFPHTNMMDESRGNYANWEYTNWGIAFSTKAESPDSLGKKWQ